MWLLFLTIVVTLLAFDLGVLERSEHEIGVAESLKLSAFYILAGLAFAGWVWWQMGNDPAFSWLTAFVLEKSLSMDNIFVFATIFGYLSIPRRYHHRVLVYGIVGVIVLRGLMIGLGAALLHQFEWILFLFGAFLVFTGIKLLTVAEKETSLEDNRTLKFLRARLRVTDDLRGDRFFVREPAHDGGRPVVWATPLFLALMLIESADLVFAVDSVPAVFSVTQDPFIVYTSNIFAILGLRALYFALAAILDRFRYVKYALAVVLVFIGGKIFVQPIVGEISAALSLGVTLGVLAAGVLYSLWRTGGATQEAPSAGS